MAPERRNQIVLTLLLLVLVGALYRAFMSTIELPSQSSGSSSAAGRSAGSATKVDTPDVRLEALQSERIRPATDGERNLFQFGARRAPAAAAATNRVPPPPPMPTSPPSGPSVPPITLKFI